MQAIRNIDRKQGQQDIKNKKDNKADNRYCPEILRPQFFFHIRQPVQTAHAGNAQHN